MKKICSLFLSLTIIFSVLVFAGLATEAEAQTLTAYVTVSKYAEFTTTKTNEQAVMLPVELTEKPSYTLDDLFLKLHDLYYDGEDGYSSQSGDYGAYITKFWGDDSENFGYHVNGEMVMGLTHPVSDGDIVDVAIYRNLYPDTENYTKFNTFKADIFKKEDFEITLYQEEYDENWNTVYVPCENATIIINGELSDIVTDADGKATLDFDTAGTYILSAYKEKMIKEESRPAIASPICVISVIDPAYELLHNIANKYCSDKITSDENMIWLIADMAVYNSIYHENQKTLSDSIKQACLDKIIKNCDETNKASTLAKSIIALRAMGYDAKDVVTENSVSIDVAKKLTDLIDNGDETVTNIYTLPYVMIALSQNENYATEEQMNTLLNAAIESKLQWQDDEWGFDAATAMLLALAPYYGSNDEISGIIDETTEMIISSFEETGSVGNAASTGLVITALSALDKDCQDVFFNENSIIDSLITYKTEMLDGFTPIENTYSTEQGFRGLLAWQLFKTTDGIMYDFFAYPTEKAVSTKKQTSGGFFSGGGGGGGGSQKTETQSKEDDSKKENTAKIEETSTQDENTDVKQEDSSKNIHPDIKIPSVIDESKTFDDIASHKNRNEIETLAKRGIINGKSENCYDPDAKMTRAEFATIVVRSLGLNSNEKTAFSDIKDTDWFASYINTAYNYGIIKGISETEFNPSGVITRQEAAVMVMRAAVLCGIDANTSETAVRDTIAVFSDYTKIKDWAKEAMAFCCENNIIDSTVIEVLPEYTVSRAEVAEMVFNMLLKSDLLQENSK